MEDGKERKKTGGDEKAKASLIHIVSFTSALFIF